MGIDIRNFGPTAAAQEEVLRQIDSSTGARTRAAFIDAWAKFPHLVKVVVRRDDSRMPAVSPNKENLAASTVRVNGDPDFYRTFMEGGSYAKRAERLDNFFHSRGIKPEIPEIATFFTMHEVGHVDQLQKHLRTAAGDSQAALELALKERRLEYASLPLGTGTSIADKRWQDNIDGYRDRLENEGWVHPDSPWEEWRLRNLEAYHKLSSEELADRFALGILAVVYPAQEQATAPALETFKVYGQATSGSNSNLV